MTVTKIAIEIEPGCYMIDYKGCRKLYDSIPEATPDLEDAKLTYPNAKLALVEHEEQT